MQKEPNKTYKDLKQKQKAKIADWMYRETCRFYANHDRLPNESEVDDLAKTIYTKICSLAIWVPYEDVLLQFRKKLHVYEKSISEQGILQEKPKKEKQKTVVKVKKKKRKSKLKIHEEITQNDMFFYIAGYTSGGAPYGVTWEEMGLDPYESIEQKVAIMDFFYKSIMALFLLLGI